MIIYKDFVTDDEILTDSYKIEEAWDGIAYRIVGKYVTESDDNAIAGIEANEEEVEGSSKSGINCVLACRLIDCTSSFSNSAAAKAYFKSYAKAALAKITERCPDKVAEFKKALPEFMKKTIAGLADYQVFQGESFNPDCMIVLSCSEKVGDQDLPVCYYFKHGLYEEKQ